MLYFIYGMEDYMVGLYMRYGYGYYFDPTYILIIIAGIISLMAQMKVSSAL